jgi:hypothetical protein
VTLVMFNVVSVRLDIVLVSRPLFTPNMPYTEKSFRMHPIVLLGDDAQVEAHFGPFGDRANLDTR